MTPLTMSVATEQHGPHLPLSVDTDIVDGVVAAALPHLPADLPALFLPTQAIGFSPEHTRFAGTLTLKADTLVRVWTEIGEAVAASGVKKLVLLNSHGGQVGALDLVARDLRFLPGVEPGVDAGELAFGLGLEARQLHALGDGVRARGFGERGQFLDLSLDLGDRLFEIEISAQACL